MEKRHPPVLKTKKQPEGRAGVRGRRPPAGSEVELFLWFIHAAAGGGSRGHGGVTEVSFEADRKDQMQ